MRVWNTSFNSDDSRYVTRHFRKIAGAALFTFAAGFSLLPSYALAVPPDCSDGEKEPLKACEEKLNTAQGDLIDELDLLITELEATPGMERIATLSITDAQTGTQSDLKEYMSKLRRQHGRARDMIDESSNADFEEMVAQGGKEKGQKCRWQEADEVHERPLDYLPAGLVNPSGELGNTLCDSFTAFDPDKGRAVSISERSQPNICVRICEDRDVPDQLGTKIRDRIKRRHIDEKSESVDATQRAAAAVSRAHQDIMSRNVMVAALGSRYALASEFPECELPSDVPHIATWGTKVVLVPVVMGLKIASRVTEGIKNTAWAACQQDIAGVNVSFTCTPAIIVHIIAQSLVDVAEALVQATDLTSEGFDLFTADATNECVKSIRAKQEEILSAIGAIDAKIGGIDTKIGSIDTKVGGVEAGLTKLLLENREYIKNVRTIVLTPQGLRAKVPLYEAPAAMK